MHKQKFIPKMTFWDFLILGFLELTSYTRFLSQDKFIFFKST
jgi:hypothetical protein